MLYLVHLYTAIGAVLGFLALLATASDDFRLAFLWLFLAVLVDASDGWLARRLNVSERLPAFSGTKLDEIVDYITYVFVPCYLLSRAGALPTSLALPVLGAILISSLYGFCREDAKTADHFFTGFPSYWNIVAFYLYLLQWPTWVNAAVLLTLCGLVFVRTTYVYPSRMPVWQTGTILAGLVWGGLLLWLVWRLPERSIAVAMTSLTFPVYYASISIYLDRRRVTSF
ncbi:MAG TPA: CDP-alcohol phosphatidyltransferase family protein [Vicinamibacterales bacterium]|jgi:phosphatidylcholine synthase